MVFTVALGGMHYNCWMKRTKTNWLGSLPVKPSMEVGLKINRH
jgi:hypothetical protein